MRSSIKTRKRNTKKNEKKRNFCGKVNKLSKRLLKYIIPSYFAPFSYVNNFFTLTDNSKRFSQLQPRIKETFNIVLELIEFTQTSN